MLVQDPQRIKQIWNQKLIPVIYRRGAGHPLLLRLPYHQTNYIWLRNGKRNKPEWNADKQYWQIPKAWFNDVISRILKRWGKVYIIQPYREQEKCAPACWNATGHECNCSCMGARHGSENPAGKWFVVGETFATKWGDSELACRLLTNEKVS